MSISDIQRFYPQLIELVNKNPQMLKYIKRNNNNLVFDMINMPLILNHELNNYLKERIINLQNIYSRNINKYKYDIMTGQEYLINTPIHKLNYMVINEINSFLTSKSLAEIERDRYEISILIKEAINLAKKGNMILMKFKINQIHNLIDNFNDEIITKYYDKNSEQIFLQKLIDDAIYYASIGDQVNMDYNIYNILKIQSDYDTNIIRQYINLNLIEDFKLKKILKFKEFAIRCAKEGDHIGMNIFIHSIKQINNNYNVTDILDNFDTTKINEYIQCQIKHHMSQGLYYAKKGDVLLMNLSIRNIKELNLNIDTSSIIEAYNEFKFSI